MKVKVMKNQKLSHTQAWNFATAAAREAMNTLEKEGYYTEDNAETLWRAAWSAADFALVCEEADLAESIYIATEAARRQARAIPGRMARLALIKAGKINPAWRVQLAQLQQQQRLAQ